MSELKTTLTVSAVAAVLAAVAVVSAPRRVVPDAFFDVGEPFFPTFADPEMAATLEIVQWNSAAGAALPFQVTNRGGRWTIPSHHDYPADGEARLATAAAEVISVVKDDFRSDNVADHEALGVIDPIDEEATTLEGRGTRITFRDADGEALAELIVGRAIEERPGFRFLRVPGQKRVYAARFGADISTRFEDWIETNLLEVTRDQVTHIVLNEYFLDERTRQVVRRGEFVLDQQSRDEWTANRVPSGRDVDPAQANLLVGALMNITITGVRPKPPALTGNLRDAFLAGEIDRSDLQLLQRRGFIPMPDGSVLSNEGEVQVRTTEGVRYTLRFGEVVYGRGDAVLLGDESSDQEDAGPAENRYVFITAEFDATTLSEPPVSEPDAHAAWEQRVEEGRAKAERLATRFAGWYYVISVDSYERIHRPRDSFLTPSS